MVSKQKTKPFLELNNRNPVILRGSAIFDSLDAGEDIVMKMV